MAYAVVQACAVAASGATSQPKTNWAATPTNGNLLLALGYIRNSSVPNGINGWTAISYSATSNWNVCVYAKYASAAAQVEAFDNATNFSEWGFTCYEISGGAGTLWKDFVKATYGGQNGAATSLAAGSLTTNANTSFLLSAFAGQSSSSSTTLSWAGNTGWTQDATLVQTVGDGFSVFNWGSGGHRAVSPSTSYSSTITASASIGPWTDVYVELGSVPGPAIDPGSVYGNAQGTTLSSGSATCTCSARTTGPNEVLIIDVAAGNSSAPTSATCTLSGGGLTYTQRQASVGSTTVTMFWRFWVPLASALSLTTITATVTFVGNPTQTSIAVMTYAIAGAGNYAAPWDTNASLPNVISPGGTNTWTTSAHPDLIIAGQMRSSTGSGPFAPTGYTAVSPIVGLTYGGAASFILDATAIQSAAGSGSVAQGQTMSYVDAIQGSSGENASVAMTFGAATFAASVTDTSPNRNNVVMTFGGITISGYTTDLAGVSKVRQFNVFG